MNVISIRQMLEDMHQGEVFSMQVVSYSKEAGTGGKLINIDEGCLLMREQTRSSKKEDTETAHDIFYTPDIKRKNPYHYHNYTRNIRVLNNGIGTLKIIKIHPPLVLIYRGLIVVP